MSAKKDKEKRDEKKNAHTEEYYGTWYKITFISNIQYIMYTYKKKWRRKTFDFLRLLNYIQKGIERQRKSEREKKTQNEIKRMLIRAYTRIYVYREVADYIQKN